MSFKHALELFDILDSPDADGAKIKEYLEGYGATGVEVRREGSAEKFTDFVSLTIPGSHGKTAGGNAPTLGLIGQLGGLGARPEQIGFVSDGDGALAVLVAAAKLLDMNTKGDVLPGDVIVSTHVDPDAPTRPHEPVPFMGASVDMALAVEAQVDAAMDAILSVDTTRGNRICNHNGFAITPTIKDGWIFRVSETLLDCVERTSSRPPAVLPITSQDITPYGNDLFHVNSIVQPSTGTRAPVVGVAITSERAVAGYATGATSLPIIDETARFLIEVAKDYGHGIASFIDAGEYERFVGLYGTASQLQTLGNSA